MALKAGRPERNPLDKREIRAKRGSRVSRRAGTKSRAYKRGYRR